MEPEPAAVWRNHWHAEALGAYPGVVEQLREGVQDERLLDLHLGNVRTAVERLSDAGRAKYRAWCLRRSSYAFPMEAYYQARIIDQLRRLEASGFPVRETDPVLCARQVINPREFNGTPSIVRKDGYAFVVFPTSAVFWMYVFTGLIADTLDGRETDPSWIQRYLVYLVAARVYERSASYTNASHIDYLLESIIHTAAPRLFAFDDRGWADRPLATEMVSACEEFICAHELAHARLSHSGSSPQQEEAEADRLAIEMLSRSAEQGGWRAEGQDGNPHETAVLGLFTLRVWSMLRLATEFRAVPLYCPSGVEATAERSKIERLLAERTAQAEALDDLAIGVPDRVHRIAEAAQRVVETITRTEPDPEVIAEVAKLSKTVAQSDEASSLGLG